VAVLTDGRTAITKACEELEVPVTAATSAFTTRLWGRGHLSTPVLGIVACSTMCTRREKCTSARWNARLCYWRGTEPGDITDVESEFGSSEYAKEILGAVWGYPPELDLAQRARCRRAG